MQWLVLLERIRDAKIPILSRIAGFLRYENP